ncbi:response regulator [Cereibacter sphaeroides]|nr:response regulator [Cereibacter sphaeroides]
MAILTVGAAWLLFMQLLDADAEMDAIVRENAVWAIFQADRHIHELHHYLELVSIAGGDAQHDDRTNHAAMMTSYDILYSRVTLLERGSFFLDLTGEGALQQQSRELSAFVTGLAPQMDALDPADPGYVAAVEALEAALDPWLGVSNDMLLQANSATNEMRLADRLTRLDIQQNLAWLALVLILAFLGIFVLMLLQLRKIARSNQLMALLQERSRRKALRAQAASRAKSAFLATMSHEIRTPLNGIIGSAELLSLAEMKGPQERQLSALRDSADLLRDLIDGILDFSRLDAGSIEQHKAETDLAAMGRLLSGAFGEQAAAAGLSLKIDLPLQRVQVNDTRLRQVLINLIGNALKFTHEGGVRVKGRLVDGYFLRVEVEDDGIGISGEEQKRLFKEFSQIDGSHRRRYGGSGLGLAISRRIVEGLGGQIGVESEPDKGSTFWFELPIEPLGAARDPAEDLPTRPIPQPALAMDVLVVEDNDINYTVIHAMLDYLGHRVTHARDGQEAVDILAYLTPDIVLMDMQMPNMDGLEATRVIRARGQDVPVVGVTANAFDHDRRACLAAGMNDFLAKPVTTEGLTRVLDKFRPARPRPGAVEQSSVAAEASAQASVREEDEIENEQLKDLAEALGPEMLEQLIDRFALEIDGLETSLGATLAARDAAAQDSVLHSFKGAALTLGMEGSGGVAQRLRSALPIGQDDLAGLLATAKRDVIQAREMLASMS